MVRAHAHTRTTRPRWLGLALCAALAACSSGRGPQPGGPEGSDGGVNGGDGGMNGGDGGATGGDMAGTAGAIPCSPGATRCDGSRVETCAMDGMSWGMAQACAHGCDSGQCVLDRLDVTMDTDLNGLVIVAGPVSVFAKATLRSSQGNLTLRAQSITVDAGGAIAAAATGMTPDGQGGDGGYCVGKITSSSGGAGGSYGTRGYSGTEIGYTCGGQPSGPFGSDRDDVVSAGSKGGDESRGGTPGGNGGGVLRLIAGTVKIAGTVSADGANGGGTDLGSGGGSGGGILIAADQLTISGTVSAQGGVSKFGAGEAGQGGLGRVKLLWGASHAITGTVTGVQSTGIMPPLDVSSAAQPDNGRWYNDGLSTLALGWTRPFPSRQGYYFRIDGNPVNPPDAAGGTLVTKETAAIPAASLMAGDNYVHFISVDAMTNLGTIESTYHLRLNATPPMLSSMSHPDPGTWSMNVNPLIAWTLPHGDDSYRGVRYAFDHYGSTVPGAADTFAPITGHNALFMNVKPGIWAFHAVSVDTAGNPTRAAAHYLVRIGPDPGAGGILGQVSGPAGHLNGATVTLNRGLLPGQSTNSDGVFDLSQVPAGTWEVTVSADGLKPATQMITVMAGATAMATFTLSR